ncbi:hypothetical protein [Priestia aryabhattai]
MKKWLISIIAIIFMLSIPVLFITWGMTWKWTSFAPGNTDAWIGFWGGYLGAIIGALAAGAIAYFVAHKQINLQAEKDNKREKQFLATQLRIEKYQEAHSLLSETNREFAISAHLPIEYFKGSIDLEELRNRDSQSQSNIIAFRRRLWGIEPFIEGLAESLHMISELHTRMANIIYDNYTYPKGNEENKVIKNPRILEEEHKELMLYTADVCKRINKFLKLELEKLEKGS